MTQQFELIVRGLVVRDGKILVCQTKGGDYFFLPGGHVEFSESMVAAIKREFMEEMGQKILKPKFIGIVENVFTQDGVGKHEVNFLFETHVSGEIEPQEDHVTFFWVNPEELISEKFKPPVLRDAVLKYLADRHQIFILAEEEASG